MSQLLVFLAIAAAAAVALYVVSLGKQSTNRSGADAAGRRRLPLEGLDRPTANLPPVLLPMDPVPADVDRLRFSLGLRGYRMDQVDEVLDRLRDSLAAKDARIAELEDALDGVPATGTGAPGAISPSDDAGVDSGQQER